MNNQQKEKISALRRQGESYTSIAGTLGISVNTVKSYCRRNSNSTKPAIDVCAHCGEPLQHYPGKKQKRFCSDKCRMAWWVNNPDALNRKAVYRFVCPVCGAGFESYGNANRRYCSRACFNLSRKAPL